MTTLGIVADDLTGATTVAALLARSGVSNAVLFSTDAIDSPVTGGIDAVVVSTDSRALPADEVGSRVAAATSRLRQIGATHFSKRIDTTCRGGIGPEVEGMLSALDDDHVAVIVPSMPQSKRIVIGGYSLIDSTLLARTGVAVDVRTPVTESHLPTLFGKQFSTLVGQVDIATILAGEAAVRDRFISLRESGVRVFLADATSLDDVDCLARALVSLDWKVVCVDPGPFTERMAVRSGAVRAIEPPRRPLREESADNDTGCVLVLAGSATAVTHEQTKNVLAVPGSVAIEIDIVELVADEERFAAEKSRVCHAVRALDAQKIPPRVIVLGLPSSLRGVIVDFDDLEGELGLEAGQAAARLASRLGQILRGAADVLYRNLAGIYLTGGDVMVGGCRALEAEGLRLIDYVIPQADQGVLLGGPFNGLPVIGKGGLTGRPETTIQCVNRIFDERK